MSRSAASLSRAGDRHLHELDAAQRPARTFPGRHRQARSLAIQERAAALNSTSRSLNCYGRPRGRPFSFALKRILFRRFKRLLARLQRRLLLRLLLRRRAWRRCRLDRALLRRLHLALRLRRRLHLALLLLRRRARCRRWRPAQLLLRLRGWWRWRLRLRRNRPHDRRLLRWRGAGTCRRTLVAALQPRRRHARGRARRRRNARCRDRRRRSWWGRGRWGRRDRRRTRTRRLHCGAGWRRWPVELPRCAVRLWRHRRLGARSRRHGRTLGSARRSRAEPPMLIVAERLGLRHSGQRLHHSLRGLYRCLQRTRPGRPRLTALESLPAAAQVLRSYLNGTGNALRARQDARLHAEGLHRSSRRGGNDAGRDARVHGKAAAPVSMLEAHCAVDDHGPSENNKRALRRQEIAAHARRHQMARRQEGPISRAVLILIDDLVRWQRRPADIVITATPIDPGRTPFVTRHPEPANPAVVRPAAVVESHPTPVGLFRKPNTSPTPPCRPIAHTCRDASLVADHRGPRLRRNADAAAMSHMAPARTEIRPRPAHGLA